MPLIIMPFSFKLSLAHLNDGIVHMALGDAFAALGNITEAIMEYELAQMSKPEIPQAAVKVFILLINFLNFFINLLLKICL